MPAAVEAVQIEGGGPNEGIDHVVAVMPAVVDHPSEDEGCTNNTDHVLPPSNDLPAITAGSNHPLRSMLLPTGQGSSSWEVDDGAHGGNVNSSPLPSLWVADAGNEMEPMRASTIASSCGQPNLLGIGANAAETSDPSPKRQKVGTSGMLVAMATAVPAVDIWHHKLPIQRGHVLATRPKKAKDKVVVTYCKADDNSDDGHVTATSFSQVPSLVGQYKVLKSKLSLVPDDILDFGFNVVCACTTMPHAIIPDSCQCTSIMIGDKETAGCTRLAKGEHGRPHSSTQHEAVGSLAQQSLAGPPAEVVAPRREEEDVGVQEPVASPQSVPSVVANNPCEGECLTNRAQRPRKTPWRLQT